MIPVRPPSPSMATVKQARIQAGLSLNGAASVVYVSKRAWQTYEDGTVTMKVGLWELFLFKTGQLFLAPLILKTEAKPSRRPGRAANLTPYTAKARPEPQLCSQQP